ncbi:LysR family glycine cleavage system transcriptional activator [Neorhizobium galegae]|uniref:LysR substrate-binding domain-containing protein n=1 Tax=Neorhizobium galegae TaxID=399 RepID=UPI001AE933AE|nr:LysR substrate-binding domain-containing protein [Neorhizobium galegae]MBP2548951.1 LysR family glycine cleavage system transcriptional activator [Neorhizobium galegae]
MGQSAILRATQPLPGLSRLPPLTALRAFVVTARYASFSKAAEDLHVTTAAIGQQIRLLETHLGEVLFSRNRGELVLTPAGASLYPGLSAAFESIVDSLGALYAQGRRTTLRLMVDDAFASRWLAPRLHLLNEGIGDTDLVIERSISGEADLARLEADCAILPLSYPLAGHHCELLLPDSILPVCTPAFAARHELQEGAHRLRDVPVIYDAQAEPELDWPRWLRACGFPVRLSGKGPRLTSIPALIETVLAGSGIALARHSLVSAELQTGRLVSPLGRAIPVSSPYYLIASDDRRRLPQVEALFALLHQEAKGFPSSAH